MLAKTQPAKTKKTPKAADVHIGARIRQRRVALGISQEALGDAIGLTFQQVQKYEKGTNRVGGSRMVEICAALKCQPTLFYEGLGIDGEGRDETLDAFLAAPMARDVMAAWPNIPADSRGVVLELIERLAAVGRGQ